MPAQRSCDRHDSARALLCALWDAGLFAAYCGIDRVPYGRVAVSLLTHEDAETTLWAGE